MNITYLRIENGFDISKITGAIPQNIGEGYQFNLAGKQYTTIGSYTKDKKRLLNIEISSFCGLCGGAIHYYAKLYIKVSNVCGNSSVSGYLGGIEIPNEYQTIKGEFVRPLTQKEKDEQPDRWDYWYQVGDEENHGSVQISIPLYVSDIFGKADALIYALWVDVVYRRNGVA